KYLFLKKAGPLTNSGPAFYILRLSYYPPLYQLHLKYHRLIGFHAVHLHMKPALIPRPFTGSVKAEHGNIFNDSRKIRLMRGILFSKGWDGIISILRTAHHDRIQTVSLHGIADVIGGELLLDSIGKL